MQKSPAASSRSASRDCTLTGLHVEGVHDAEAGVVVDTCDRFNITGCTILDCDNVGLLVRNLTRSRISDCLIRDDRPGGKPADSLKMVGGQGNQVVDNLLSPPLDVASGNGKAKTGTRDH